MVQRLFVVSAAFLFLIPIVAVPASDAQVFGQFSGVRPLGSQEMLIGTHITFADNAFRWIAQGRMGVADRFDMGIQAGITNVDVGTGFDGGDSDDSVTDINIEIDGKYQIVADSDEIPFDISLGGGLGVSLGGDIDVPDGDDIDTGTVTHVHFSGLTGKTFELNNGHDIVPYASLVLAINHLSVDIPTPTGEESVSDTDTDVSVRLGTTYELTQRVGIVGEIEIGDDVSFGAGVNFGL